MVVLFKLRPQPCATTVILIIYSDSFAEISEILLEIRGGLLDFFVQEPFVLLIDAVLLPL